MFSRLREHLGGAGLIVAIVALVAALSGAAIAANGGGEGKATASAKAKKGPPGPRGKTGKTGPAGPAGPAGPQGPKGDTGAAGSNGTNGKDGAKGATGATGATGEDGTFSTEPLPDGESLTGAWAASGANWPSFAAISFPIRVSPAPTAIGHFEFGGVQLGYVLKDGSTEIYGPYPCLEGCGGKGILEQGEQAEIEAAIEEAAEAYEEACPGNAATPEADAGFLCFYRKDASNVVSEPPSLPTRTEAAHEFGITIPFQFTAAGGFIRGGWAVTG